MKCPYCDADSTSVIDTRETAEKVRRRRECRECDRRFTTYETAEKLEITVVKNDGSEEEFKESKIREGVKRAGQKTELTDKQVDEVVEAVKKSFRGETKIKANKVGEKVKDELKKRNEVAYIRFASVYDSFDDAETFKEEVEALQKTG